MSGAYYNEIDPFAAEWLRRLILFGHVAPGEVDERSIEDVNPDDLRGYDQHHFFAGIGVWSAALRGAGWSDDRPVWTGSCPCQPFSGAGKGGGFADERHLWPAWFHLIRERRPGVVFGEQVSDRGGLAWLDLVQADLEGEDFAVGALGLCSAGVGASDRRHRFYFVGHTLGAGLEGHAGYVDGAGRRADAPRSIAETGELGGMAHPARDGRIERGSEPGQRGAAAYGGAGGLDNPAGARRIGPIRDAEGDSRDEARVRVLGARRETDGLDVAERDGRGAQRGDHRSDDGIFADATDSSRRLENTGGERRERGQSGSGEASSSRTFGAADRPGAVGGPGPINGFWRNADWVSCRDQRWRPVEPGTFPLAHGATARVGRLRGYGNAINKEVAQGFIEAAMTCIP